MTPKIFLVSAALVLAGGSANALNLGGAISTFGQKLGGAIGDTECTASKCGSSNVSPNTVNRCFLQGEDKISRNPNCSNAFFKTSCGPKSRNRSHYDEACQNVAEALGLHYSPAPQQQMRPAPQQQMRPAPQQQMRSAPQQQMRSAPQQQMRSAPQQKMGPQRQPTMPQQHFQSNQGGYSHDDYGQGGYSHDDYGQGGYGHDDYGYEDNGQGGYGHEDYGHDGYEQDGHDHEVFDQGGDDQYEMGAS